MVRYGDQEQSSPGGAQRPLRHPRPRRPVPSGSPPYGTARAHRTGRQDGEARLAEQDDTRQVPHPRQAAPRRASLLRRPESLRAIPSLARFLAQASAEPGDARTGGDPPGRPAGRDRPAGASARPRGSRGGWQGRGRPARTPGRTWDIEAGWRAP